MNLLPKSHQEFSSPEYWDKFFKKRGSKAFEWYGEYPELCTILHKYIKLADHTLVVGCGSSALSADMYDVGYRNITNIDISDTVIKQMTAKNAEQRPDMKFLKMDVTQMSFGDGSQSVVLDKGTLDALMPDQSEASVALVDGMFGEVSRVLRVGGRYLCVSLAQGHILHKVLHYFTSLGWMVRVCRVADKSADDTDDATPDFVLPVFVFVLTKFKKMPNMKQILEVCTFDDKVERFNTADELVSAVQALQQYSVIRHQLNRKSHAGEHISLDLYSAESDAPRYTLYIIDSPKPLPNKFAVFIVPEGREPEWIFATDEGRQQLLVSAGFQRLVVATLSRHHDYGDMEAVKQELSGKVMELCPANLGGQQVPFLSLGDDINTRSVKHRGSSVLSGDFVIEDVECSGRIYRRLIFISSQNVIQSEARLVEETKKKKGGRRETQLIPDVHHLSIGYYAYVVAGLALLENFQQTLAERVDVLLVGLGGGNMATFLHHHFPQIHLDVVEIDPAVVSMATHWFGFHSDERLRVHVGDGLQYILDAAERGARHHVVILDVDSKDLTQGMSCPPESFLQDGILQAVNKLLQPTGVFVLNLVCRSKVLRADVLARLTAAFSCVCTCRVPDDVNETLYCLPTPRPLLTDSLQTDNKLPKDIQSACRTLHDTIKGRVAPGANRVERLKDLPKVTELLNDMKLL